MNVYLRCIINVLNMFQFSSQVFVLQEDLKATEDEYEASRQVIEILQAQVEVLTREKEVM